MKSVYIILAVAVLLVIGGVVYFIGFTDAPTSLTNAAGLKTQILPKDLTVIVNSGEKDGDAAVYYDRAIVLYSQQRGVPAKTPKHDELVAELCGLLEQAADAGHKQAGFMDRHIPVKIGAQPDFGDAVEVIYELAIQQSAYRYTHGDSEGASKLALAVWVFGQRMFEDNVRMYNRVVGMDMMESAGSMLYPMSVDTPNLGGEALRAWSAAIRQVRRHWQPKLEVVMGLDPPIGDLVNIALHDGDRMFRVEATLRLGIHKHGPVGRGNLRAIQNAIRAAVASDDPMLAEAGRAAEALTLEQKRRLY